MKRVIAVVTAAVVSVAAGLLLTRRIIPRRRERRMLVTAYRGEAGAPSMEQDAGWVVVLPEGASEARARGHVLVSRGVENEAAAGASEPGAWHGRLDSLRLYGDASELSPGRYRLRFERNGEEHLVDLDGWQPGEDGRGSATLRSADGELPTVLLELGGS